MSHGTFATAITCMDGRLALPVINWIKKYDPGVDFVDMVTEAGADGALASLPTSDQKRPFLRNLKFKADDVSVKGHGSRLIVVVGHEECAGHPVKNEQHEEDIKKAVKQVKSWGTGAKVVGVLFKKESDAKWLPQIVA